MITHYSHGIRIFFMLLFMLASSYGWAGCSLLEMQDVPPEEQLIKLTQSSYILTPKNMYYFDISMHKLEHITKNPKQLNQVTKMINQDLNALQSIEQLSLKQLKQITSITNHTGWAKSFHLPLSLWDVAQPSPKGLGAANQIFSFTTPAASRLISLRYRIFSNSGCNNPGIGQKTYNVCIDNAHANKTFYITLSGLYKIMTVSSASGEISTIRCVREVDQNNNASFADQQTTCSTVNETCTNPSANTLNISLTSGGAC